MKVTLARLRYPLPEVEGKEFENDREVTCYAELASVSRCIKSPPLQKGAKPLLHFLSGLPPHPNPLPSGEGIFCRPCR